MGEVHQPNPVLLVLAAFSRRPDALDWARDRACRSWGPAAIVSRPFHFDQTAYYTPTMGTGLLKQFLALEQLIDPGDLSALKRLTNQWEQDYAQAAADLLPRPLNLDPGYITPAKLVLASTKDFAHRLYLGDGIYAEVTLQFRHGAWRPHEWTFPDYERADYHEFFSECRDYLLGRRQEPTPRHP
jgi:hypothetical protein